MCWLRCHFPSRIIGAKLNHTTMLRTLVTNCDCLQYFESSCFSCSSTSDPVHALINLPAQKAADSLAEQTKQKKSATKGAVVVKHGIATLQNNVTNKRKCGAPKGMPAGLHADCPEHTGRRVKGD